MEANVFKDIDELDAFLKSHDDDLIKANGKNDDDEDEDDDEKEEEGMEKSADIDDLQDEIDSSPILKAVVDNLDYLNESVEAISGNLLTSVEKLTTIVKSLAGQDVKTNDLLKSVQDDIAKIGNQPVAARGVQDQIELNNVLLKSLGNKKNVRIDNNIIKATMLKGAMENRISSGDVTKFELGAPLETLETRTQNFIKSSLEGGIS